LVLYRLDQDNVLIRDKRNVSGMAIGTHQDHIDGKRVSISNFNQGFLTHMFPRIELVVKN
jgi:hypothetical protein